ncbi:MAG: motility protein MotB [Alphaproteobacteria bacterium]|nr:MAG: motility protein MotB [Alphaproteobacteria bacterium]
MAKNDEERPILIKRVKKVSGGHHGGAWKVAYADFTTAMMAFFMLLWLLNVTTEEQREGLADYFAPTSASVSGSSGSGGVLGGTSLSKEGSMASGAVVMTMPKPTETPDGSATGKDDESSSSDPDTSWQQALEERENMAFADLEEELRQSLQEMPDLAELAEHLVVDVTEDGMRIQLIDKDHRSMFKPGTDILYGYAQKMLQEIAVRIEKMPNRIEIIGHTDAKAFSGKQGYSNWELSADRANAARRVLSRAGISSDRFSSVRGKAATEPLLPDSPRRAENRRITILLLREAPVVPPKL